MSDGIDLTSAEQLTVQNYCVGFIDMLGMKVKFEKYKDDFIGREHEIIDDVVAPIIELRKRMEFFCRHREYPLLLSLLPSIQYAELAAQPKTQNWSDGLVLYSAVGSTSESFSTHSILGLIHSCGTACFFGLVGKTPVRGAIEMDWGIEIVGGDVFGAAVAASYKLESDVADCPRIVVGKKLMGFLRQAYELLPGNDYEKVNQYFSGECLKWICEDFDGQHIVDYLKPGFFGYEVDDDCRKLLELAYEFIQKEYAEHKDKGNTKLAMRYIWLREYFVSRLPALGVLLVPAINK